ncbi:hypothetical protein MASR2M15_03390 [Anaerolineales bacterium]
MTKRLSLILILILALAVSAGLVSAQEELVAGTPLTGEISNQTFELEYSYSGTEGEVIVIELRPVEEFGDLDYPEILLLDSENTVINSTVDHFDYGEATLIAKMPATGTYTVLATRQDGRSGDSVGQFTIQVIEPTLLSEDVTSNSITNDAGSQYYLANFDKSYSLIYLKKAGDFGPEVVAGALNETEGQINDEEFVLSGERMSLGSIGIFDAGVDYIVIVRAPLFSFYFDAVSADYELNLYPLE